jgi:hypothetical protein
VIPFGTCGSRKSDEVALHSRAQDWDTWTCLRFRQPDGTARRVHVKLFDYDDRVRTIDAMRIVASARRER